MTSDVLVPRKPLRNHLLAAIVWVATVLGGGPLACTPEGAQRAMPDPTEIENGGAPGTNRPVDRKSSPASPTTQPATSSAGPSLHADAAATTGNPGNTGDKVPAPTTPVDAATRENPRTPAPDGGAADAAVVSAVATSPGCIHGTQMVGTQMRHTTTCRIGASSAPYDITATPTTVRRLVLRNLDNKTTIMPRVTVQGWPDLSSTRALADSLIKPGMTDEQKAIAFWQFIVKWRYHYLPAEEAELKGNELHDPIKYINVYGYGFCDDSAKNIANLARTVGMKARVYGMSVHVVAEVFFAGGWHMFDADHEVYYRMADGHIASVDELAVHPEVLTKTPVDPVGTPIAWAVEAYTKSRLGPQDDVYPSSHRIEPKLMPGDEAIFDLTDKRLVHAVAHPVPAEPPPPVYANGRLVRRIVPSATLSTDELRVDWPYAMLGGELRLPLSTPDANLKVEISSMPGEWAALPAKRDGMSMVVSLDAWFAAPRLGTYAYTLRLSNAAGAPLGGVAGPGILATVFQFSPRALPQVKAGRTTFVPSVTGDNKAALPADFRNLEIVHEWDEAK